VADRGPAAAGIGNVEARVVGVRRDLNGERAIRCGGGGNGGSAAVPGSSRSESVSVNSSLRRKNIEIRAHRGYAYLLNFFADVDDTDYYSVTVSHHAAQNYARTDLGKQGW
jgi:hypothetical protein